ncbi:MAG: alpha/beta hydrolase [Lentisphaeria bacterium]|nr:alpha/beta hydrolase [Lentisphaeria bacterium]
MTNAFPFGKEYRAEHWGTRGNPGLHFLHANSYCAGMYAPFLQPLFPDYDIHALEIPGHGRSAWSGKMERWSDLADYLIAFLDNADVAKPLIGMGHSIGGVATLIAAVQRPDLFKKLVLLDPVLLPPKMLFMIRLANLVHYQYSTPLIKSADRRRRHFASRKAARAQYEKKRAFKRWKPEFLDAYVECGFQPAKDGGVELSCSPELEISIYRSIPTDAWRYVQRLKTPTLILGGEYTDTLLPPSRKKLARYTPLILTKTVPGGHLFPFEHPAEAMQPIKEFLQ